MTTDLEMLCATFDKMGILFNLLHDDNAPILLETSDKFGSDVIFKFDFSTKKFISMVVVE